MLTDTVSGVSPVMGLADVIDTFSFISSFTINSILYIPSLSLSFGA